MGRGSAPGGYLGVGNCLADTGLLERIWPEGEGRIG